jgi:Bacterial Ig domain
MAAVLTVVALSMGCADRPDGVPSSLGDNQAPLGVIEQPADDATVASEFKVAGWAGDDRGIVAVRVYVDEELKMLAGFALDRPDVTKVYPHFRHGTDRHGYEATVRGLSPGPHTVRVDAIDSDGVTAVFGTHRVTVGFRQQTP